MTGTLASAWRATALPGLSLAVPTWVIIAVPAAVLAVGAAAGSVLFAVRRRRLHRSLIKEVVSGMSAQLDRPPSATAQARLDLVREVAAQEALAEHLDRDVRPRIPARLSKAAPATPAGPDGAADLEDAIRFLSRAGKPAPDGAPPMLPGPLGPAPMPDAAELSDLYGAMRRTVLARIRQATAVVQLAEHLDVTDPETCGRLVGALNRAAAAERDSRTPAAEHRPIEAMRVLAQAELPVPDHGMPGEATYRDFERQTTRLMEVAAVHRTELHGWCRDALSRCRPT